MSTYNKNGATITITPTASWTSTDQIPTETQLISGFDASLDNISFNGKVKVGRPTVVASVVVEADSNKYFLQPPYLKTKSTNISLRLRNKKNQRVTSGEVDGIFYTSYTYDLIFISSSRTSSVNDLNAKIVYKTETIPSPAIEIHDIKYGDPIVSPSGESRKIKVIGSPTAIFGLAINENYAETITLSDGDASTNDEIIPIFNKYNDVSIIKSRTKNTSLDKVEYNYGKKIDVIKGTIPSSGIFEFTQEFPSTISSIAAIAVAASSANKIKFTNLDNVRVGDRMYYPGLSDTSVVTVNVLNPDGDNENECTLLTNGSTASISLAKGKKVTFRRSKTYSVDIIPSLTSTLGSKIPTRDPEYKLYQYLDPTLTITHVPNKSSGVETIISKYNDVATGLSHSEVHSISYNGKALTTTDKNNNKLVDKFSVKLELTVNNGAQRFTAKKKPRFNYETARIHPTLPNGLPNTNLVVSNWTNSIGLSNGGTFVNIYGIRFGALNATTINLWYTVEVKKWGNRSVNMVLDLGTLLTNAVP